MAGDAQAWRLAWALSLFGCIATGASADADFRCSTFGGWFKAFYRVVYSWRGHQSSGDGSRPRPRGTEVGPGQHRYSVIGVTQR